MADVEIRFRQDFEELASIGRDLETGGIQRGAWNETDLEARRWFLHRAQRIGLEGEIDRNGNLWAWLGDPGPKTVATGSHLDSVPQGGLYDGALGVVSALVAVEELKRRRVRLRRPLAVVVFAEEEGARYGVPTLGSRLMTGSLDPERILGRTDGTGVTMAEAVRDAGLDPDGMGHDRERLGRLGAFVELHIEQGRRLAGLGAPVGVCREIWPHGRWRLTCQGQANHAGTAELNSRRDPMLALATAITAARYAAAKHQAVATIGKVWVHPNGANIVPRSVEAWLDARAPDRSTLHELVDNWANEVGDVAAENRVKVSIEEQSYTEPVTFDAMLERRMLAAFDRLQLHPPVIPTAAGHDAGSLAPHVPSGMIFVRNPTGISHSPEESAAFDDCVIGVEALATILEDLAG